MTHTQHNRMIFRTWKDGTVDAWLPMPDGKFCANTEENINALLSLLRKR